jgi:hypothetical protein
MHLRKRNEHQEATLAFDDGNCSFHGTIEHLQTLRGAGFERDEKRSNDDDQLFTDPNWASWDGDHRFNSVHNHRWRRISEKKKTRKVQLHPTLNLQE